MLLRLVEYGLIFFAFFLPLQTRLILRQGEIHGVPVEYGTFSIYGTEILLWIIFIVAIIAGLRKCLRPQISQINNCSGRHPMVIIAGLLFFWSLISILWSDNHLIAFRGSLTLASGIGLFLVLNYIPLSRLKIIWAFIAGVGVQALLGIYQFLAQTAFASKWLGMALHLPGTLGTSVVETASERWLRAYGSLPHPNILAGYLVVALLLIFNFQFSIFKQAPKSKFLKILLFSIFYFLFSILAAALFFTFSRGAWLALLVGISIMLIYEWYANLQIARKAKEVGNASGDLGFSCSIPSGVAIPLFLCFCVFMFLAAAFWQPFLARTSNNGRLEIMSNQERTASFKDSWEIIKQHPLLGVGIGNYTFALQNNKPGLSPWAYQPVHNIFFLVASELGIIGFIFFVLLLFSLIQFQISPPKADPPLAENFKFQIIVSLLVLGLFDHYLWSFYAGVMLFWLTCGLTISMRRVNTAG